MFELLVRLSLATAAAGAGWSAGSAAFNICWRVAVVWAAIAVASELLQEHGKRDVRSAIVLALADTVAIALVVAACAGQERVAFLAAVPSMVAVGRRGANPLVLSLASGAIVLSAANLIRPEAPTAMLAFQALGAATLVAVTPRVGTTIPSESHGPGLPAFSQPAESISYLELRESYRSLRDRCRELERRGRKDRIAAQLREAAEDDPGWLHDRLAKRLQEISGATGLTLHVVSQLPGTLVVRGAGAQSPDAIETVSIDLRAATQEAEMRLLAERTVEAFRTQGQDTSRSVLLKHRGKLVGLVSASHADSKALDTAIVLLDEAAPIAAQVLVDAERHLRLKQRAREAELLHQLASAVRGAESLGSLAGRIVREVREIVCTDHLAVWMLDGHEAMPLASEGSPMRIVESMSFAKGPGIAGWLGIGSPELCIPDAHTDSRLPSHEALRKRIGSFCLVPIGLGQRPLGFLTAAARATSAFGVAEFETLRAIGAELGQLVIEHPLGSDRPSGLATTREFQRELSLTRAGFVVTLELLKREELLEAFGRPALERAMSRFAHRIRARLPQDALTCRMPPNELLVLLRGAEKEVARSWANEAAATAAMINVTARDGITRIPLAFRAKVAEIRLQFDGISVPETQLA